MRGGHEQAAYIFSNVAHFTQHSDAYSITVEQKVGVAL